LNIVGDSKNTIRYFVSGSIPRYDSLKVLIECSKLTLSSYLVQFYHIIRENNKETNEMANCVIDKDPGSLWISGDERITHPP
jgi:hypothetical protein